MGLLEGERAVVTGAGSGIGRATCLRFAAEGATVVALDIDEESVQAVAAEMGGDAVVTDVADGEALTAAMQQANETLGGITIVVNNAGVGNVKPLHRYRDREYDAIVDASLRGTFNGIRAAAPLMLAGHGGSIVNVSSVSGMRPTRGEAPYSAAKAGVIALTQSAALEYGPTIRVNCVSPGLIDTPLTAPLFGDGTARAAFEAATPLRRIGTVVDVADAITFLSCGLASYITGVNLPVEGGSLLPSSQMDTSLSTILSYYE